MDTNEIDLTDYGINEKILLEKFNLPDETRVHKMHELVYNYLKTFHDTDHMEEIKHMREDVEKTIKGFEDAYGKRYEEVNKLLFKFWKVSKMDEKGNPIPVMYIFPYKLLRSNCYLFTLCSYIKPEYNANNGLHEESFDIMENYLFENYDLLFEETTEDEMMLNAKTSCEDALGERMWKLKYRDHVLE